MNLFDKLTSQIACVGLPLFAVSLTAVPRANTPVMLMLHWHGFRKNPDREHRLRNPQPVSVSVSVPVPVPGSALQINEPWSVVSALDHAMLDAAWRLGAWELERDEKRACNHVGATDVEATECRQAFASHAMPVDDGWIAEAPDQDELMHLGARVGYLRWLFRPVRNGIWGRTSHDDTLGDDGSREPPCPVAPCEMVGTRISRMKYRLGHSTRIVFP